MIQQLESSIDFDCHDYTNDYLPTTDPELWLETQIADTEKALERHQHELEAEGERARTRTNWVQALRKSLQDA